MKVTRELLVSMVAQANAQEKDSYFPTRYTLDYAAYANINVSYWDVYTQSRQHSLVGVDGPGGAVYGELEKALWAHNDAREYEAPIVETAEEMNARLATCTLAAEATARRLSRASR